MKTKPSFPAVFTLVLFGICVLVTCNKGDDQQESNFPASTSVDLNLPAMYTGTLPCASCPGINYQLILEDGQFTEISVYQDRAPGRFEETGDWEISGDTLSLVDSEGSILKRFLADEESLTLLDKDNQQITGDLAEMYILEQTGNQTSIREHHQKLAEQGHTFFAAGNEPFWSLKVDSLNHLIFETPELSQNLGETDFLNTSGEIQLEAETNSTHISVHVRKSYCRDSMSGYLFPQTATAILQTADVDTLHGCGVFLNR